MTDTELLHLALQTMLVATKIAAPILIASLGVGFAVSLFQSLTQINEVTLTFVPKLIGVGLALLFCGDWMLHTLITFTANILESIPNYLGS